MGTTSAQMTNDGDAQRAPGAVTASDSVTCRAENGTTVAPKVADLMTLRRVNTGTDNLTVSAATDDVVVRITVYCDTLNNNVELLMVVSRILTRNIYLISLTLLINHVPAAMMINPADQRAIK